MSWRWYWLLLLGGLVLWLGCAREGFRGGEALTGQFDLPPNTYVIHVSRSGVLAYRPLQESEPSSKGGCAGFACTLFRSSSPGRELKPVSVFEQVNYVFGTSSFPFVWARKPGEKNFALYFTRDAGKTWELVPGTAGEFACPPWLVVTDPTEPQRAYIFSTPGSEALAYLADLGELLSLKDYLETEDEGKH
ncbi:hypothetical protein [Ammonifex thiophilus]|uniref:hypothetical protein n=1 Tax=Ammonifex thiophilus TaxID=444093 RepID=UPI001069C43C|nr:hypothetical protein [Ammonifex thiophilus]